MLDIEDYRKYDYSTHVNRYLQLSKYYLRNWGKVENNISDLTHAQKDIARMLFYALKGMKHEERAFLADKYRHIEPVTDEVLAQKYSMRQADYAELRRLVEYKFFYYLKDHLPESITY